ncbi:MAG: hypothetical protein ABI040_01290, partial [Rhodoferax sp.]
MTSQNQDVITVAQAPWRDSPEVVREVQQLKERFSASDLCVAYELCDRHPAGDVAFTLVDGDLTVEKLTYGDLADRSRRLASALAARGVG